MFNRGDQPPHPTRICQRRQENCVLPVLVTQVHKQGTLLCTPPKTDVPDWYCQKVFTVISPGIDYAMKNGLDLSGLPKKHRGGGES